jgi:hypothetical protein
MGAVNYTITIEPEDESPNGQFDGEGAEELVKEIYARLEHDLWAWCFVIVTASIEVDGQTFSGRATLGGCSYFGGESEFRQAGGYYGDLCNEAKESLLSDLREAVARGIVARKVMRRGI